MIYGPPYSATREQFGERRADEVADFQRGPGRLPARAAGKRPARPPGFRTRAGRAEPVPRVHSATLCGWRFCSATLADLSHLLDPRDRRRGLLARRQRCPVSRRCRASSAWPSSLRAPARFGVLVLLSVAVLASIGAARLYRRWPHLAPLVPVALTLVCLAEYWSSPIGVRALRSASRRRVCLACRQPAGHRGAGTAGPDRADVMASRAGVSAAIDQSLAAARERLQRVRAGAICPVD